MCPSTIIYAEFMKLIEMHALTQKVLTPTRQKAVLDLVLCTDVLSVGDVSVNAGFGGSDHDSVQFMLLSQHTAALQDQLPSPVVRDFRKLNEPLAKQLLSQIDWQAELSHCTDAIQMWSVFKTCIERVFDHSVPWVKINESKQKRYPRFIQKLLVHKRRLYTSWKRLGTAISKQAYRDSCRAFSEALSSYRKTREKRILVSGNRSQFYRYVNEQRTVRSGVAPLHCLNGTTVVKDSEKAAVLNEQFASVFTVDNGHLPPLPISACSVSFSDYKITPECVRKVLCKLDHKYGNDPDGIPSAVLCILSYELAYPLALIFSERLASGIVPPAWKLADITPLFKKGSASEPANYRPISITSAVCRVFERILVDHAMHYLVPNGMLSDEQFGFLKRRSAELQLLSCVDDWSKSLDLGLSTDVLYIDYAKAFDTVCHRKLLYKLEKQFRICGNVLRWIRNFLTGRLQRVKVGASYSGYKPVISGVPQGTVCGPILFLLYVNDIVDVIPATVTLKMFADDVKLYLSYRHEYEHAILHNSLVSAGVWSDTWQLIIQGLKSSALTLGKAMPAAYSIADKPVPVVKSASDLGVIVDSCLSFREHVSSIVRKANFSMSVLFKCFTTSEVSALILAYTSYIRPILEYSSTVWNPTLHRRSPLACLTSIDKLESVQRCFTRRLFSRCMLAEMSYVERIAYLKLEPLELRRLKFSLSMVYKMVHGLSDVNFSDYFKCLSATTPITRGHCFKLRYPPFHKDVRLNTFAVSVVSIWNELPESIVSSPSLSCFRSRLSTCKDLLLGHCVFSRNL